MVRFRIWGGSVGIYIENDYKSVDIVLCKCNLISEILIPRGLALLLEDLLIFQVCPLEESASHHENLNMPEMFVGTKAAPH